jgi:hypothetical protein
MVKTARFLEGGPMVMTRIIKAKPREGEINPAEIWTATPPFSLAKSP